MGEGASGEFEKRQMRDERRLTELVTLWFDSHGCTLKGGEECLRALNVMAERMGNPCAADFTTMHFTKYCPERLGEGG